MIKLRAFRAVNETESCLKYVEGHVRVLTDYGIVNVTSNNLAWIENPMVYGVIAENEEGEMVGGIKVQVSDGIHPLPVEEAVGDIDPNVHRLVEHYAKDYGVGELCGLWNAKKVAGIGLSIILVRAGISIINQLNFKIMVGICAEYTLPMFTSVGFVVDNGLGDQGKFIYPNENYIARVLGILNAETMETAHPCERDIILNLRNNPRQKRIETEKGELEVYYNLVLPSYTKS